MNNQKLLRARLAVVDEMSSLLSIASGKGGEKQRFLALEMQDVALKNLMEHQFRHGKNTNPPSKPEKRNELLEECK